MIKKKLEQLREEFFSYTRGEWLFILSAMICGFCISAEYGIVRPVCHSVFIHAYGAKLLPYAWLATVPLNFVLISLYNRFLPKIGCFKMFVIILSAVACVNMLCGLFLQSSASLPFVFYVWKEVYVLLLFQQLWSVVHSTISMNRAKYLYGILFTVGALGGMVGSLIPSLLAIKIGSESLLFLSFPFYILFFFFYRLLLRHGSADIKNRPEKVTESMVSGFNMIRSSRFLTFILCIVVFMQVSSAIIDYQFNAHLETAIPDKDARTAYTGHIFAIINCVTIGLQTFGTFLLIRLFGLKRSHFLVPLTLCLNTVSFILFPVFGMISFSYITIKSFDFSLFGVIKEMLYIPLKVDEKFRAKAVIDVFAYRSAKAFASCLILLLQFFNHSHVLSLLTCGALAIFLSWSFVVSFMFKTQSIPSKT